MGRAEVAPPSQHPGVEKWAPTPQPALGSPGPSLRGMREEAGRNGELSGPSRWDSPPRAPRGQGAFVLGTVTASNCNLDRHRDHLADGARYPGQEGDLLQSRSSGLVLESFGLMTYCPLGLRNPLLRGSGP